MRLRIAFRQAARAELQRAVAWYEEQRCGLGNAFALEIGQILERVADSPLHYPVVSGDVLRAVARRFPFAIYFRLRGNELIVLAVFHGRRDPTVWQQRT
jgi:plasmid stabilization system protein ParE